MAECLLPKQDVASSSLVSRFFPRSRTQVAKGAVCKTVITGSNPVGSLSLRPLRNLHSILPKPVASQYVLDIESVGFFPPIKLKQTGLSS